MSMARGRRHHISLVTMGLGFDSSEAHIEYLGSVAGALGLS